MSLLSALDDPGRPSPQRQSGWRLDYWGTMLALVVCLAFITRLAWILYALRAPVGLGDSQFYLQAAQRISDGDGYVGPTGQATALWPPGYSIALAIPLWLVQHTPIPGDVVAAGGAFNLLLGTATVALVGMLSRRLLGPASAVGVALIVACFPSLIMFTAALLSETLFTFLLVSLVTVLAWHPWRQSAAGVGLPSDQRFLIAGLIAGYAVLVRPTLIPSLALIPVAVLVTSRNWRVTLRRSAPFVLAAVAVVIPWTIRNTQTLEAFVPISTNTGYNLCIGNNPEATGAYIISDYCFHDLPLDDTISAEVERNQETNSRAVKWITAHPGEQPRLVLLRVHSMFANDSSAVAAMNSYGNDPWMTVREMQIWGWISDWYFFGVATLGLIGFYFWSANGDRRKLLLLLIMSGFIFATLPFFGDTRFKVPMLPLLSLFAVAPIAMLHRQRESVTGSGVQQRQHVAQPLDRPLRDGVDHEL